MKKSTILLGLPLILILASLAVVELVLRPQVENEVRALTSRSYETPMGIVNVSAESVVFSPYSRQLVITQLTAKSDTSYGPLTGNIAKITTKMPLRAAAALTTFRDAFLPEKGPFRIMEEVRVDDESIKGDTLHYSTQNWGGTNIDIEAGLLRNALDGKAANALTFYYGIGVEHLFANNVTSTLRAQGESKSEVRMRFKSLDIKGHKGRSTALTQLNDFELHADTFFASIASLTQEDALLPDKAQLERMIALSYKMVAAEYPSALEPEMQALVEEIFYGPEPLLKKMEIRDVTFGIKNGLSSGFKNYFLSWPSNKPLQADSTFTGLILPVDWLRAKLDLDFPGHKTLLIDLTSKSAEIAPERNREEASIVVQGLGALDYGLTFHGKNASFATIEKAITNPDYKLADMSITYKDTGLLAYVLRSILSPNAGIATMTLQSLASEIFTAQTPENAAGRAAFTAFVDRPGSLSLKSAPGKAYTLMEMFTPIMSGNLGALFTTTNVPGTVSLEQQMQKISAMAGAATAPSTGAAQ